MSATPQAEHLTIFLGLSGTNWHPWVWAYRVPYRKTFAILAAQQKNLLSATYPRLNGIRLAEVTAAMCEASFTTVGQLIGQLGENSSTNAFALGVYWYAGPRAHPFMGDAMAPALRDLKLILPHVSHSKLKQTIAERIEYAERSQRKTEAEK